MTSFHKTFQIVTRDPPPARSINLLVTAFTDRQAPKARLDAEFTLE